MKKQELSFDRVPHLKKFWMDNNFLPKSWIPTWIGSQLLKNYWLEEHMFNGNKDKDKDKDKDTPSNVWSYVYKKATKTQYSSTMMDIMLKSCIKNFTLKKNIEFLSNKKLLKDTLNESGINKNLAQVLLDCDDRTFNHYLKLLLDKENIIDSFREITKLEGGRQYLPSVG